MRKKNIVLSGLIYTAILAVTLTGCGGSGSSGRGRSAVEDNGSSEKEDVKEDKDKNDVTETEKDDVSDPVNENEAEDDTEDAALKEVYSLYLDYLIKHEDECCIRPEFSTGKRREINFSDITGDEIPEMFSTSYEYYELGDGTYYGGYFIISGVQNGKVTELSRLMSGFNKVARSDNYLFFKTAGESNLYCLEESYDKYAYRFTENSNGNLDMEELFTYEYWDVEEYDHPEPDLKARDELLSKASEVVYYWDYIEDPNGSWYDACGLLSEEAKMMPSDCKYTGMTYDEAIAWLKQQIGDDQAIPVPADDESKEKAEISFSWDISTVTIFEDNYDQTADDFPEADSSDLRMFVSTAMDHSIRPDGWEEYRDGDGNIVLETCITQKGNEKNFIAKVYSFDQEFEIFAETVALVFSLPTYRVDAEITFSDGSSRKLTVEDMRRRSYTSVWYYGICRCENGKLADY